MSRLAIPAASISRLALLSLLVGGLFTGSLNAAPPERQPVNINAADAETIAERIKGIGLKRAQDIVAYREANGPFRDVYELTVIKGIGERIVANNESRLRLTDTP
ncbi:MAG: ComEA family DNA-binding protein [Pseudomonadota bacterium]